MVAPLSEASCERGGHLLGPTAGVATQLHSAGAHALQVLHVAHQERGVAEDVLLDGAHHVRGDSAILRENSQHLLCDLAVFYLNANKRTQSVRMLSQDVESDVRLLVRNHCRRISADYSERNACGS